MLHLLLLLGVPQSWEVAWCSCCCSWVSQLVLDTEPIYLGVVDHRLGLLPMGSLCLPTTPWGDFLWNTGVHWSGELVDHHLLSCQLTTTKQKDYVNPLLQNISVILHVSCGRRRSHAGWCSGSYKYNTKLDLITLDATPEHLMTWL